MKKTILAFIFALITGIVSAQTEEPTETPEDTISAKYHYNQVYDYYSPDIVAYHYKADDLMKFAKKYVGVPYVLAGKDSAGFDCAGYTFYCFKKFGVYLPYFAYEQGAIGQEIQLKDAKKGDLICFLGSNLNDKQIGHVGIVISEKGQKLTWIHAASRGVRIDNIDSPYYKPRLVTIRRVAE
jgi:cell wall-associated NlpC family hydrolase